MNVIYFPNLRSAGSKPVSTGTMVTDAATVDHSCLDVFVRNTPADPLNVNLSLAVQNIKTGILHDASSANINGTYQAVGGVGTIPANSKIICVSSNIGAPLSIGIGLNSAAITKEIICVPGQSGIPFTYDYTAGEKLFVKTLDGSTQNTSYLAVNFTG